jgi:hypothetical protein
VGRAHSCRVGEVRVDEERRLVSFLEVRLDRQRGALFGAERVASETCGLKSRGRLARW